MSDDSVLSAADGADRVAARGRRRNGIDESAVYTCEGCGRHDFVVFIAEPWTRTERRSKPCDCGRADDAGYMEVLIERSDTFRAALNANHEPEDREPVESDDDLEESIMDQEVACARCFDDPTIEWEIEVIDADELDLDGIDRYVECAQCGHEIEFGYSHAHHVGRLWPCESSDFNPWMTFPDIKYVEAWRARGWLRPGISARGTVEPS